MQEEHSTKEAIKASINPNERLKNQRERRGWTRDYVAEKIGSDTKSVGRWERGAIFPSPYYRQRLCELFGMNAEELGFFKEEVKNSSELHPIREEPPPTVEVTNRETGMKSDFVEKSSPPRLALDYQDLSALIVIGGVIIVMCTLIFSLFAWRLFTTPTFSFSSSQTPFTVFQIKPGGTWVNPPNETMVHGTIHFAAKAYPTHHGEPAINHVNFTVGWGGAWRVGCIAYPPASVDNIYACDANLTLLNAPAGPIKVSFDVYDQQGNYNLAPNGVHTLYYQP